MLKAITRGVSRHLERCELTFRRRDCLNYERAVGQHEAYRALLRRCGAQLINLEASDDYPDCCFVEDTAVVFDELAVVALMGAPSRRGETPVVEKTLSAHREIVRLAAPATLDGGDVVRLGRRIFVGRSQRTNAAGVEALARVVEPFGYEVTPVAVRKSLHLTTACSALDEETVLLNPQWIDAAPFARCWLLPVPEDEPWAANTLRIGETVCVESGAPRTLELVGRHCANVEVADISEFRKAEGSLSCLSILFRDMRTNQNNSNREVLNAE
ncbi:MAG TPA: arginine deiminase family protein [Pyrinomonadaceae bacterium]|jgi:dimethylargininase|nr:arginine deiminase family protein [Pyrinomonadaceae bacterium]